MIITGALKGRDHYIPDRRDLIDKIAAGIYEPGTLLPYEALLARNYKVSISTIRKSLALLNGSASKKPSIPRAYCQAAIQIPLIVCRALQKIR